jgi:hypothetical protein
MLHLPRNFNRSLTSDFRGKITMSNVLKTNKFDHFHDLLDELFCQSVKPEKRGVKTRKKPMKKMAFSC